MAAFTASKEASERVFTVKSTTEHVATGTRNAYPLTFPAKPGNTFPSAFDAPDVVGTMFCTPPRPRAQSFWQCPSTLGCEMVKACTVVMAPLSTPKASSTILARGARQLVVHDALDTTRG